MFKHIGQVTEESNGNLKITRNGQTLVLHRPNTKDVANADEVMSLRHFLEQSETIPTEADSKVTHLDSAGALLESVVRGLFPFLFVRSDAKIVATGLNLKEEMVAAIWAILKDSDLSKVTMKHVSLVDMLSVS